MDKCTWRLEDYDYGRWKSECELSWYMSNDDTPTENNMNYCPKCGKELVEEMKNES